MYYLVYLLILCKYIYILLFGVMSVMDFTNLIDVDVNSSHLAASIRTMKVQ